MKKSLLSFILTMMLVLSSFSGFLVLGENNAYAAEEEFAGGTGIEEDPFLIANAEQLDAVRNNSGAGLYFKLVADIDLSGYASGLGWDPIGDYSHSGLRFKGVFEGNGHTISNLRIDRPNEENVGLFDSIGSDSVIANLKLKNVQVTGMDETGAFVGSSYGNIINSSSSGKVTSTGSGAGGLVGRLVGSHSEISDSHSTATVRGADTVGGLVGITIGTNGEIRNSYAEGDVHGERYIGGIVGYVGEITISDSYATGDINATGGDAGGLVGYFRGDSIRMSFALGNVNGTNNVGGLVGYATSGLIESSYATGEVHGTDYIGGLAGYNDGSILNNYALGGVYGNKYIGGLVGYSRDIISYNYATGLVNGTNSKGGLVGYNTGSVSFSFYNEDTTGQTDTGKGEGRPSADMALQSTYAGWDFSDIWVMSPHNGDLPVLQDLLVHVTYDRNGSNGSNGGSVPLDNASYPPGVTASVYSDTGNLVKTGYTFSGWNTSADGNGTSYPEGGHFRIVAETTLHAEWVSSQSHLSGLSVDQGTMSPIPDNPALTEYTVAAANSVTNLQLTLVKADSEQTITVTGAIYVEELDVVTSTYAATNLSVGANVIEVKVTAPDGVTQTIYKVIVNRASSSEGDAGGGNEVGGNTGGGNETGSSTSGGVEIGGSKDESSKDESGGSDGKVSEGKPAEPVCQTETTFSDIAGHWAEATIKQAFCIGLVTGYPDGLFQPDKSVTREECIVMLIRVLNQQEKAGSVTKEDMPSGSGAPQVLAEELPPFSDARQLGEWSRETVAQAVQAGIIKGYPDGTFKPAADIIRAEMVTMVALSLNLAAESDKVTRFADDGDIPVWARDAVDALKILGLVEGRGANIFAPYARTTRAEAITILLKLKGKL